MLSPPVRPAISVSYDQKEQTLTEHWGGTNWSVISSPHVPAADNNLEGVATVSAQDTWAVGVYDYRRGHRLIEHWDGQHWSIFKQPNSNYSGLTAVAALSADNIWAVGTSANGAVTEHWDGTHWRLIPNPGSGVSVLNAVSALTASDVWAVGFDEGSSLYQTLAERWNGKQWLSNGGVNVQSYDDILMGVSGVSAHNVWAVGYYGLVSHDNPDFTLIEHYC